MEVNLYAVNLVVLYIGLGKIFCSQKRKMAPAIFHGAAIAFFLSLFRLYLNEQPLNEESFINLIEELF